MGEPATAKKLGFSAMLELDGLEPLVTLLRRSGYDAELRVRTEDGAVGLLRYAAGELTGGVFEGVSGPIVLERLLALGGGVVELEVLSSGPALLTPAVDTAPAPFLERPRRPMRRVEAIAAFGEPPTLRRWSWVLAPGLALALWAAVELAAHMSQPQRLKRGLGAPAAPASVEPRGPAVVSR